MNLLKKILLILISFLFVGLIYIIFLNKSNEIKTNNSEFFLASNNLKVDLFDENLNLENTVNRGAKVTLYKDNKKNDNNYYKIKYNNKNFYVNKNNIVNDIKDIVLEDKMYVRTSTTVYKNYNDANINGFVKKGSEIKVLDYDALLDNGNVNMYKIKYDDNIGYVYSKYLSFTKEEALKNYDDNGLYQVHKKRGDSWGGGDAGTLDYYPYDKPKFENNVMPKEVRSLYVDVGNIYNIDKYIELAKKSGINAIVVDIKDGIAGYPAETYKIYSPSQYKSAVNTYDKYKNSIKKIKDANLYVIGRITTFKDSYYAKDHPENTILNRNNKPYRHDGAYWPSAYNRNVWEFNVALAIESVKEMGFNEIQFDYVRFPDRVYNLEKQGLLNYNNKYNESKAQAIQNFVMYACDELHKYNAYVSIDVFGESAHNYVTPYGQYWPAISNIADVISAMPYPDHFGKYEYGLKEPVWTIPYQLLNTWGKLFANKRQTEIPTPAIARTWIQAYNTIREPYVIYDENMIAKQIQGLYDAGLTGGFITWNGGSNLNKYIQISPAFGKEY